METVSLTATKMSVLKTIFLLSSSLTMAWKETAENQLIVDSDARNVQIPCSAKTDGHPFSHLAFYKCPTMTECKKDWDRYLTAWIENGTVYYKNSEGYKLSLNGTLTVPKMSPKLDGIVFWCITKVQYQQAPGNTTVIQIARVRPKIRMNSPQPFLGVEGMNVLLEYEVTGYPPPQVICFRNRDKEVLVNRTGEGVTSLVLRNVTEYDDGEYNCTATNPRGSDSHEAQVKVIGDVTFPRSDAPDSSKSPPPEEDTKVENAVISIPIWCFVVIICFLVSKEIITMIIMGKLFKKMKHWQCSRNQQEIGLSRLTPEHSVGSDSGDGESSTAAGGDSSRYVTTQVSESDAEDVFENEGRGVLSTPTCEHSFGTDSGDGEGSTREVVTFDSREIYDNEGQGEEL